MSRPATLVYSDPGVGCGATLWPWLVQMGGDRGGWYSWDWLDNDGKPSADRIVPEWQSLGVGQQLKGPWWLRSRTARWCCSRATGCPRAVRPVRGPIPCPGRGWTGSGAFICVRLPAAGPVW